MAETAEGTDIGYGVTFAKKTAPDTYVELVELVEFDPPEFKQDSVEFTHHKSPERWREFKPGLRDAGETSLTYNLIPGLADDDTVADAFAAPGVQEWRVKYPDGATLDVKGFFTSHKHAVPIDDRMTGSATFKISGKPVITPAPVAP